MDRAYKFEELKVSEANYPKLIRTILKDKSGFIWFGTETGLYRFDGYNFIKFLNITNDPASLSSNKINCFCDDGNYIWIGTSNGLNRFDKISETFKIFVSDDKDISTIDDNVVTAVCNTGINELWVGTNKGLNKFDKDSEKFIRCRNIISNVKNAKSDYKPVTALHYTDENVLWIGVKSGEIFRYNNLNETVSHFQTSNTDNISNNQVISIVEAGGIVWAATLTSGLYRFDKSVNQFTNVKYAGSLNRESGGIRAMSIDKEGILWMEADSSLIIINPGGEIINRIKGDDCNKFYSDISAIYADDDGIVWICGYESGGFMICNKSKNLNNYEGYFLAEENYKGIFKNYNTPKVILTDFSVNNMKKKLDTSITVVKEIVITSNENFFTFGFAALDYWNPAMNQYAYKLEGVDADWKFVGNQMNAYYTDVSDGQYVFRVMASNNDGVWNDSSTSVKLTILPPWYKTNWFRILSVLTVVIAIATIYRMKINKVIKEKKIQEEFSKKIIKSQEDERKRIAAELHDSLGQDLVVIRSKALLNIKKTDDPVYKNQLSEICELTSMTINDIREISYNLRPHQLDRLGLIKTLNSLIKNMNNSTDIDFVFDFDQLDQKPDPEIEINIYRIVQECFNNIIKHSKATEVLLKLNIVGRMMLILVSDNGKGFNIEKNLDIENKGFGLKGIPERVKLFGGSFHITSKIGRGTQIKIFMPFHYT